jgi:hypothetical protein
VQTQKFSLGGGEVLTLWLYIIYVWFWKLCYKNHVHKCNCNITLQLHLYTYKYNYMFHDSITVSYLIVFFFNFINLFFKILMYLSSVDFSGWFRLKGKSRNTFDIIISTKSVLFKFRFWWVLGSCSPASFLGCTPV